MTEKYLGQPIRDVVISVPIGFSDAQRGATKDAATIAGLNVLRLINDTSAAAMAYAFNKRVSFRRDLSFPAIVTKKKFPLFNLRFHTHPSIKLNA